MRRFTSFILLALLAACGSSTPTGGGSPSSGTPASVVTQAGDGQQAAPGAAVPINPAVMVRDASGAPVSGVAVAFTIDSGGGSVTGGNATTGSNGIATIGSWTLGPAAGTDVLRATVAGLPPVRFRANDLSLITLLDGAVVPASGGSVSYIKPGDPYTGVMLTVPNGAFPAATNISIQVDGEVHPILPSDVRQVGPAFLITDGKGFAALPMTLQLPLRAGGDTVLAAFFYDPATGTLESAPLVARDANSISIASRHFSADHLLPVGGPAGLRSQPPIAPAFGAVYLIVAAATPAALNLPITTAFVPGTDDWEFHNYGTFGSPNGICAGMSVSALYYFYRFRNSTGGLNHRFDTFASLEFDNPQGERLATTVQVAEDWDNAVKWLQTLVTDAKTSAIPYSQLMYQSLAMTLKVTHQPQFVGLEAPPPALGGHAVVAYAVNNGAVAFADPNQPGVTGLAMHYANGAFDPVQLSVNAAAPPSSYTTIEFVGVSAMVDMTTLDEWWAQFVAGTSGTTYFPPIQRQMFDQAAKAWVPIPANGVITTSHRILALRTLCPLCTPWRTTAPATRVVTGIKDTINVTRGYDATDADSAAVMVFGTGGGGNFRVSMQSFQHDLSTFIDEQFLTIVTSPVMIVPGPTTGPINADLSFVLHHSGLAGPGAKFTWDFGDSTATVTKTGDSTVTHQWKATGVYTLTATVDDATGKELGSDQTLVTIIQSDDAWQLTSATLTNSSLPAGGIGSLKSDTLVKQFFDSWVGDLQGTPTNWLFYLANVPTAPCKTLFLEQFPAGQFAPILDSVGTNLRAFFASDCNDAPDYVNTLTFGTLDNGVLTGSAAPGMPPVNVTVLPGGSISATMTGTTLQGTFTWPAAFSTGNGIYVFSFTATRVLPPP